MNAIEQRVMKMLSNAPGSFEDLFDGLVWDTPATALDDALESLLGAKKIEYDSGGFGMYSMVILSN